MEKESVETNQKLLIVAILLPDKVNFRSKTITRDKEGHFMLIKEPVHQKNITTLNVYAPNKKASK